MIVRPESEELVLVTQTDHAHLSADVIGLWRRPGIVDNPRRQGLLRAIRLHDNGWREADAAPRIDPERGAPLDFTEIPVDLRAEIWRRGILRYRREDPYVALLVLRHARALHEEPPPPLAALFEELEEEAGAWREQAGVEPAETEQDYVWLALGDVVSLVAANGWEEPRHVLDHEIRWADDAVRIDPFPLAGTTRFPLSARRIPRRGYESDRDLAVELATARWERLTIRIAPPG